MTRVNLRASSARASASETAPHDEPSRGSSGSARNASIARNKPRSLLELEREWGCGRLPFNCALRLLLAVMSELQQLHQRGEAHGELTPAHILLLEGGGVKLVAASRLPYGLVDLRKAGILRYLAPERLRGAGVAPTADIFSVGVMLWEALAGRPLFELSTIEEILGRWQQVSAPLAPTRSRELWVNSLAHIAARALHVAPEQRYPEMQRLRAAVELLAGRHAARVATWDALLLGASPSAQAKRTPSPGSAANGPPQTELEISRLPAISLHGAASDDGADTIFDLSAMPCEIEPEPASGTSAPLLPSRAASTELPDDELPTRFMDTSGRTSAQTPSSLSAHGSVRPRLRRARPADARSFRPRPFAAPPVLAEPADVQASAAALDQMPTNRSNERTLRVVWALVIALAMIVGVFSAAALSTR